MDLAVDACSQSEVSAADTEALKYEQAMDPTVDACSGTEYGRERTESNLSRHAAVCAATDLPVAWSVATARDAEQHFVAPCSARRWSGSAGA